MDEMWRRFKLALEPLKGAGKLGAVLFQFPPWFYYRRSNLAHIGHCAQVLDGYRSLSSFPWPVYAPSEPNAAILSEGLFWPSTQNNLGNNFTPALTRTPPPGVVDDDRRGVQQLPSLRLPGFGRIFLSLFSRKDAGFRRAAPKR